MARLSDELSDTQVALAVLQRVNGLTREKAMEALLADPSMVGQLAAPIAQERARLKADEDRVFAEAHARSPQGRAEAARAALAEAEEEAQLARGSRVLLERQGVDVSEMSDLDVLEATGVREVPFERLTIGEQFRRQDAVAHDPGWDSLPAAEKDARARAVGSSAAEVESYRAALRGEGDE